MIHPSLTHMIFLFLAALAGGAMNSLAGGGTLLTFPMLLSVGITPTAANATSTVALVPGSFSAWRAYRNQLHQDNDILIWLGVPSLLGGLVGACLVFLAGDKLFGALVPWLILGATVLFIAREPISRWIAARGAQVVRDDKDWKPTLGRTGLAGVLLFQFLVAVYGGFFGAGIGILMLATLSLLGLTNIHRMNGLKNYAATCINTMAALTFIASGRVHWPIALLMAVGAIIGAVVSGRFAQKIPQVYVRKAIVVIGLVIAASQFLRVYQHPG